MAYSTDLREKVVKFVEEGGGVIKAALLFGISRRTILNWTTKKRNTGTLKNKPLTDRWKKLEPQAVINFVKEHPDFTLGDYAKHFGTNASSICIAFKRLKITRKKRLCDTGKGMKKNVLHFWSSSVRIPKNV